MAEPTSPRAPKDFETLNSTYPQHFLLADFTFPDNQITLIIASYHIQLLFYYYSYQINENADCTRKSFFGWTANLTKFF